MGVVGTMRQKSTRHWLNTSAFWSTVVIAAIVTDVILLVLLWSSRVPWALLSPWQVVPAGCLVLFVISSALLLVGSRRSGSFVLFWIAVVTHFSVVYGVAFIVFPWGFGFDPLIHQATEHSIVEHGWITPFQPFYLGQYAVVAALHFLTRLPVEWIDRALVPVLTVATLPAVAYVGLRRGLGVCNQVTTKGNLVTTTSVESSTARFLILLLPLLPFTALTFTTPYNLTVLFVLWWVFLLFGGQGRGRMVVPFAIAIAALATHPLLGAPLLIGTVFLFFFPSLRGAERRSNLTPAVSSRAKPRDLARSASKITVYHLLFTISFLALAVSASLVGMIGLFRVTQGFPFFAIEPGFVGLRELAALFIPTFSFRTAAWFHYPLYAFAYIVPFAVIALGVRELWHDCIRGRTPTSSRAESRDLGCIAASRTLECIIGLSVGIALGVIALTLTMRIPNVPDTEQAEFALRLLHAIPIFFLPAFLVALSHRHPELVEGSRTIRRFKKFPFTSYYLLVPIFLTTSLYLTYPQANAAVSRAGWNVAGHDIEAVRVIDADAAGESYVVLSDRLLAAVALREFGFHRTMKLPDGRKTFIYSLERDGPLQPIAEKILRGTVDRVDIDRVRTETSVARIYVAIHEYWHDVEGVSERLIGAGGIPLTSAPYGVRVFGF